MTVIDVSIINFITFSILLILNTLLITPIHELCHFLAAYCFSRCSAIIVAPYKIPIFKDKIIWIKNSIGEGGQTFLNNDYLVYTEEEIKKIAMFPFKVEVYLYCFLHLIISAMMIPPLFAVLSALIFTGIFAIARKKNFKSEWNDFRIKKDPKGFIKYMEKERKYQSDESYIKRFRDVIAK